MRRVKIVCTLGPSTSSDEMLERLMRAGMDVARLNFSHGDHGFYRGLINRIRHVSARVGRAVSVLQDLQGPKIRTRLMQDGHIELKDHARTIITTDDVLGTAERFGTQYAQLAKDVRPDDVILLDDGKIAVKCLSIESDRDIVCEVVRGGILSSNKGINVPHGGLSTPSMTEKDIRDLHFGAEIGVDAVALSFVRSAEDVRKLRKELAQTKSRPLVLAKIEKQQALEQLGEILDESDGVMVARGDLGVELPFEMVPMAQKHMVHEGLKRGKTVIVATQMLESMIHSPRPTRAEASDVANAVLDGADMVMLSAETASGEFPTQSVGAMDRIIREVEKSDMQNFWRTREYLFTNQGQQTQNAVSLGATRAAEQLAAKAIVIYTTSGHTARLVSAYRPKVPIIAFAPSTGEQRRLNFSWGVQCEIIDRPTDSESLIAEINARLQREFGFSEGDVIVLLTKIPLLSYQRTNTVHVHTLTRLK